jgi:ABC-2 type transport system ATP-binding protein
MNAYNAIEVSRISKSFGKTQAVQDISFEVHRGEIFGLLGPNGAGKTTSIRIALDIFKPDSGSVSILGGPMSENKKNRIGYMPEERGLYQDLPLERCLVYLASLKGLSPDRARQELAPLLERFDLQAHKQKKIKELSKGMQQKAQIINTILHQPELIIIDEPFTALDPINTRLVKELIQELSQRGTTLLMSTHQMNQVEELCDRILLINQGRNLLYGELEEIRERFSGHDVWVRTPGELPVVPGVEKVATHNRSLKLSLAAHVAPQQVLKELVEKGVLLEQFEIAVPSLDEIFIRVVQEGQSDD